MMETACCGNPRRKRGYCLAGDWFVIALRFISEIEMGVPSEMRVERLGFAFMARVTGVIGGNPQRSPYPMALVASGQPVSSSSGAERQRNADQRNR
jgi:hypothetical protein